MYIFTVWFLISGREDSDAVYHEPNAYDPAAVYYEKPDDFDLSNLLGPEPAVRLLKPTFLGTIY